MEGDKNSEERSDNSLFRKEVLEKKKGSYLGKAIIITPFSFLFWSLGIFVFAIALGLFLYFGKYTRRQEVYGMLVPNKGLVNIYAEKPGIIINRFVEQGEEIKKEQLLYFISTEQHTLTEKSFSAQQIELLTKQVEVQKDRIEIFKKDIDRSKTLLDKHLISEVEYQKKYDAYLSAKLALHELEQRINQIKGADDYAIRAPCDGTVSALIATVGDRVTGQRPLVSIIPKGAKFQGMLFVPARSIGFVKPGQKVLLKYQAYPYQQFGLYGATIDNIDRSILSPEDVKVPISLDTPFYRVTVNLKKQNVTVYGKTNMLTAGMLFEASILSEECTIWQWIMRPIYGLKGSLAI